MDIASIFKIILIILIYCIISGFIVYACYNQYIIDHWGEYKCQPYIMPIAGLFGKSTVNNFTECLFSSSSSNFSIFMQPLFNITGLMNGVLGDFTGSLNSLRQMGNQIRGLFGGIGTSIMNRISDTASTLQFLFVKMTAMIQRLFGVFTVLIYTMITTTEMMTSVINGPIGSLMNTFCFDKNTIINLNNGQTKIISHLDLKDILCEDNLIVSIIKSKTILPFYEYNNTKVTGGHLVFENKKWIPIYDSESKLILDTTEKDLYCLTTQNHIISCENNIFRDYIGTSNNIINTFIKNCFLNFLNNRPYKINDYLDKNIDLINKSPSNNFYLFGFSKNTLIKNLTSEIDDSLSSFDKININDIIEGNSKVLGIIKHRNLNVQFYQIDDILVSGDQIIYFDKKWMLVKDIPNIKSINYYDTIYHLITDNNKIKIGNYEFRDFQESNNQDLNTYVDNLILDYINIEK